MHSHTNSSSTTFDDLLDDTPAAAGLKMGDERCFSPTEDSVELLNEPPSAVAPNDLATLSDLREALPPCPHNHFDNARVKNGFVSLRCRDCNSKWVVKHPMPMLCPEFHATRGLCCLGSSCPYIHVHRFKNRDRCPNHPRYVGEPRDDWLRVAAIEVLSSGSDSSRVKPMTHLAEIQRKAASLKAAGNAMTIDATTLRIQLSHLGPNSTNSPPLRATAASSGENTPSPICSERLVDSPTESKTKSSLAPQAPLPASPHNSSSIFPPQEPNSLFNNGPAPLPQTTLTVTSAQQVSIVRTAPPPAHPIALPVTTSAKPMVGLRPVSAAYVPVQRQLKSSANME